MPAQTFRLACVAATAAAFALSGCSGRDESVVKVTVIGPAEAPFESGPRLSAAAQLVRSGTAAGLVGFDAQGRIVPALADRWIVTDDGKSYIFRLRDGTWADGTGLSGESARAALRQAISALRGTPLALDLADIEDIRAMAGRVVEIRLSRPAPDFLQLLAQPELGLIQGGKGAGPMALRRKGKVAQLTPVPPEKMGLPAVEGWAARMRPVWLDSRAASAAVAAFDTGDTDVVMGGRIESFPLASRSGLTRAAIRMDAVAGLFGLIVTSSDGLLASAENREALAMAIDRDGLMTPFGLSGWTASTRVVTPGIGGESGTIAERWTDRTLAQRQAEAAGRIKRWLAGKPAPSLRISLPAGPGADLLFQRLDGDFGAIGIKLVRVADGAAADLRLIDAVARYPNAAWFLNQLSCASLRGPCSPQADALVAQARSTAEASGRAALIGDAEVRLAAANIYLPFGPPVRWSLVGGSIDGFSVNRWGFHPLMPLAARPK